MPSNFQLRKISQSVAIFKKVLPDEIKAKSVSSHQWLSRQLSDPYVEKAKLLNYRCRSAFKLIEIDDRFKFLQPGHTIIDCGASPGSWTQVAVKRVNADLSNQKLPRGVVLAIDKQHIYPIQGATIFGNMDFTDPVSQKRLMDSLSGEKVHTVISDMAPNATGVRDLDNENIIKLCYSALKFALHVSRKDGSILVKLWQCGETKQLESDMGKFYNSVKIVKPNSSRSDSTEIFMLGRQFKGLKDS